MNKYDLHAHTYYSTCASNKPESILKAAKKQGLNGIAITDHNTIKGALKVKKLNKDKDFEVIIGEEISTDAGDVIALYIKEEIKTKSLMEAIDKIKEQNGIIIIPHPFRPVPWLKFRYPLEKLVGKVDAIETFNSRNPNFANKAAEKAIKNLDFSRVGSSDAHIQLDIGKGYTLFKGDLRTAIKKRKTAPGGTTLFGALSIGIAGINKRVLTPLKVKKKWI